mgnify:CR=1 FL=1
MRLFSLIPLLGCLAVLSACGGDADSGTGSETPAEGETARHALTRAQAAELLVKVGDTEITVGEFAERLADQSPYLRARYNSPERRREFLENLVRFELLAAEARRRGMEDLPEVAHTRKQVMIQTMMRELFEDRIRLADITEDEIRAYYDANGNEFHKPAQVRASQILIRDRAAATRVLQQVRAREDDVNLFRRLADEHDEDPVTSQGSRRGDLRFFSEDGSRTADGATNNEAAVPVAVAEAAFSIDRIGGVFPDLVQTPAGFHIVKLTGRRAALERTLEEARRPIQNRLWREKRDQAVDEFVARLRSDASIEENVAALESVRIDPSSTGSMPMLRPNAPADVTMNGVTP